MRFTHDWNICTNHAHLLKWSQHGSIALNILVVLELYYAYLLTFIHHLNDPPSLVNESGYGPSITVHHCDTYNNNNY